MNSHTMRKHYIRIFRLFSMLISLSAGLAYGQDKMTWQQAIALAVKQNSDLQVANLNLQATEQNVGMAAAGYKPNLLVSTNITTSKQATFSENFGVLPKQTGLIGGMISQMIFNEQIVANHAVQKYLYASEQSKLQLTKNNVIFQAGQAYINYLMASDLLNVQNENLTLTRKHLQTSEDRLELGAANQQEVLRWQTQVYASEQQVEQQKSALVMSRTMFNNVLNLPLETEHDLQAMAIDTDGFFFKNQVVKDVVHDESKAQVIRDYMAEFGLSYSPLIPATDRQIMAMERMKKASGRWAIPMVSFQGGMASKWLSEGSASDTTSGGSFWKYGLQLNWNVFDGGKSLKKAKQTNLQLEASKIERENAFSALEQGIRSITAIVIKDYINVGLALQQARAADENYLLVYDNYLLGETALMNLIDAQEVKLVADTQSKIVYYTFLVNLLQLEQALGYYPFYHQSISEVEVIGNLEQLLLTK